LLSERFGERIDTVVKSIELQLELPAQLAFRIKLAG
jgi:hypothetical protein